MIKSISFIVLTQIFNFNQLKFLRLPKGNQVTSFFKLNQQYFLQCIWGVYFPLKLYS